MLWLVGLAVLPWAVVAGIVVAGVREPRALPSADAFLTPGMDGVPAVRIIVPARDEARNIEACLSSLATQEYPDFAITLIDDRSTDETAKLAQSIPHGNARTIDIISGEAPPVGLVR